MTNNGGVIGEGSPRRRPPLWHPAKQRASRLWVVLGALCAVALCGVVLVPQLEEHGLASSVGRVKATIVRVEGGVQRGDLPGSFRYLARLPDGNEVRFESQEPYASGTEIEGMLWRGRITGRTRLTGPYRVVSQATPSANR